MSRKPSDRKKKTDSPPQKRIALIGFRGVGKSTIARHLEGLWQIKRVSLDSYITEHEGQSIEELVQEKGWNHFREKETYYLQEVSSFEAPLLVDMGGGIVEGPAGRKSQEKIDILKASFLCIYCYIDDDKLLARLDRLKKNKNRPALSSPGQESLSDVLQRRKPWYNEVAHAVVDVSDVSAREAAERITQLVRGR